MERSQVETTSFCFSPHRHLNSETYRALVQILSHCYDHSQVSAPQDSRPGMCGSGELVGPNAAVVDNSSAEKDKAVDEDRWFGDDQIVLDEIQDILQVEENGNLLKQELAVCDGDYETGNFDKGLGQQRMLMDELEHIMKGDVILVHEEDALVNDRQEHVDIQQIVNGESRSEAELQVDKGDSNLDVPKSFDSSVDRNMDSQASKPAEDIEERNSKWRTNSLEFENEMQQKEMEEEKLVHTNGIIGAHDHRGEDVEVEEGEISGHFELDEVSIDMIIDNSVVSNEKKEDEKQVSKDVTDKTDFPCNEKFGGPEKFSDSTSVSLNAVSHNASCGTMELQETVRNETQCKSKIFADGTAAMAIDPDRYNSMPGVGRNKRKASRDEDGIASFSASLDDSTVQKEVVRQRVTQEQGITTKEKLDSGVCNKRKRSALSKEKKAKKKQKERKKRAEKNRQLGIRRLKLPQNLKPKTVKYCHHYLKGRCQEGDKCKFSHDTVPLTKSTKACCHFARNSCMKGDNCPFDHDLSKYPCENFAAKGFCNRGDNCLFSHKLPPKEQDPPTPSTCTPKLKPSPPSHASNLLKPLNNNKVSHQNVDALSNHGKVSSFKNIEQSVAKSILKPPALAPKGISYLFLGKSSFLEASNLGQGISSPKKSDSGKFANQTAQIASDSVQSRDETPRRLPVASKGVNFLSFGNRSLEDSSGKKLANLFLNRENGAKTSLSNNFGLHEKSSSSSRAENDAKVGNATTQIFSNTVQESNDMPKKAQPAITPRGLNFLSTDKALANNAISNNQARLCSSAGDVINRSLEEIPNTPNMSQNSSANPWSLPGSSFTLDHSAQGYCRSTSNSAQRALEFATKIEPKVKINQSTVGTAVKQCNALEFATDTYQSKSNNRRFNVHGSMSVRPFYEGTPADCVSLALSGAVYSWSKTILVISGINKGSSFGHKMKLDVSCENDLKDAAIVSLPLIFAAFEDIQKGIFPKDCLLNVDIPSCPLGNKGLKVTRQSMWRSSLNWQGVLASRHLTAGHFLSNQQSLGGKLAQLSRDAFAAGAVRRLNLHQKNMEIESMGVAGKFNEVKKYFRLEILEKELENVEEDVDFKALEDGFVAITPVSLSSTLQSEIQTLVSNWKAVTIGREE